MIAEGARSAVSRAEKALRFLSIEVRGLHAAASVLAGAALLSSLLALVRDRLFAHSFGASTTLDIYYMAFRMPDIVFAAVGALVSVYILIPELVRRSETAQRDYLDTILAGFAVLSIIVSGTAALFAPYILATFFPEFNGTGYFAELVLLTRILLLQPILLGLSNIFAAVTQARHRYALYALSPLLYNLGIILGITVFYPEWGIPGLGWGVVFGAVLHLCIQLPSLYADGFLHRVPRILDIRELLHTAAVSLPRALALSMGQLSFFVLAALAATLPAGSVSVLMFGFGLQAVPLAIIGAAYSVAAFPTLALALAKGEKEEFISHVATAARYVFFWSLPAAALILVLRAHIVRVVLGSGEFDWTDTRLTAAAFALLSLSLASQGLMLLLVRGYYAAGRAFAPFVVAFGAAVGSIALGYFSIQALAFERLRHVMEVLLRVEDIPGSIVLGLAFAFAAVTILSSIIMLIHFEYRFRGFFGQIWRAIWQGALAALAAGAGSYIFLGFSSALGQGSTALSLLAQGLAAGFFGIFVGCFMYFLLRSQEYAEVWASMQARLWRVAPKEEVTLAASAEESQP